MFYTPYLLFITLKYCFFSKNNICRKNYIYISIQYSIIDAIFVSSEFENVPPSHNLKKIWPNWWAGFFFILGTRSFVWFVLYSQQILKIIKNVLKGFTVTPDVTPAICRIVLIYHTRNKLFFEFLVVILLPEFV